MCRNNCNLVTGSFILRSQDTSPEKSNFFFIKIAIFRTLLQIAFLRTSCLDSLDACLAWTPVWPWPAGARARKNSWLSSLQRELLSLDKWKKIASPIAGAISGRSQIAKLITFLDRSSKLRPGISGRPEIPRGPETAVRTGHEVLRTHEKCTRAGAQQHTLPSAAQFYVLAM
jgi:hypothetical protein